MLNKDKSNLKNLKTYFMFQNLIWDHKKKLHWKDTEIEYNYIWWSFAKLRYLTKSMSC